MDKLLLFDIDGTLITGRGIPKKIALDIIRKHFPAFQKGNEVPFNGMTDPLIVQSILAVNDHLIEMDDPIINIILDDFISELKEFVNLENPPTVFPGVKSLLESLSKMENIFLGLVTGNVIAGAQIKLEAVDLFHYFEVGAFGSDHWNRNELPPIAIMRAEKSFKRSFIPENIWIIGDSPKDVECAKTNNLKCLAVETGEVSKNILHASGADFVIKDLQDLTLLYKTLKV